MQVVVGRGKYTIVNSRNTDTPKHTCTHMHTCTLNPIFVIKAKDKSRYRNLVDLLDEMTVTGAPKYAIDKYTDDVDKYTDECPYMSINIPMHVDKYTDKCR